MAISWGTIKSVLIFVAPILLPKALSFYRSSTSSARGVEKRPIPANALVALSILLVVSVCYIVKALPFFAPENIFSLTASRLQISTDLLFSRLSTFRPNGLTALDEALKTRLLSKDGKLLYFQYGPEIVRDCPFCTPDNATSYLYYAFPSLLAPHLFNLVVLALVTSERFIGREGSIWRTTATYAALIAAGADIYTTSSWRVQEKVGTNTIDAFYWNMHIYRLLGLAFLNTCFGSLLYLSTTHRAFILPPTPAESIEKVTRNADIARNKMSTVSILRNTINRDPALRSRSQAYWVEEGRLMGQTMEDREVLDGVQSALQNRVDVSAITRDAETYSRGALGSLVDEAERNGHVAI